MNNYRPTSGQEEMDKFLETYSYPRLNHENTESINWPITSKEVQPIIKNLLTNQSPDPDSFTGEFYDNFKMI